MKKKSKIVFFGNERLSSGYESNCVILKSLLEAGYEVVAVVANHKEASSRNVRSLEVAEVAKKAGIPVFTPSKPDDIVDKLRSLKAEVGVLVAYGRVVPSEVISLFPKGILNIHPSLLPSYRGSTPIEQAILDGVDETGVSIMQLAEEMDAGPVYAQERLSLNGKETKQELTDALLKIGKNLILNVLPGVLDDSLEPTPQDDSKATFCKQISKEDGRIDWAKPATQIEREIRAYAGWPRSFAFLGRVEMIITKAHDVPSSFGDIGEINIEEDTGVLMVQAQDGYICVDQLIPAGKNEMPIRAFLSGYKDKLHAA